MLSNQIKFANFNSMFFLYIYISEFHKKKEKGNIREKKKERLEGTHYTSDAIYI